MELPRGLQKSLPKVNETKPAEIKCPVVENYRRRFTPQPSNLPLKYNPNLSLQEVKTFWILSALKHCNGSYTAAAKLLGIGRETIYRLVRELND
jgi:transcriptional regulator of acetoin/glycerol metabolism